MPITAENAITTYVSDMLALAQHVAIPLDTQVKDQNVLGISETAALMPRIKQVIDRQVDRLRAHLDQLGGHPTAGVKEAMTSIIGNAAAVIDKTRKTPVSKMVRDDQTALALMTCSYTMLHATSVGLNDNVTAEIARRSLEELTPLVMDLNRCVPAVVISELQSEGLTVNAEAIQKSIETTQKAWN
jgi:ferritin-like metal-binding protein YciE